MVPVIERDHVYGDFQAVERLNAERGLFKAACVRCGTTRRFLTPALLALPLHDCDDRAAQVNSIRKTLGRDAVALVDSDEESDTPSVFAEELDTISQLLIELDDGSGDSTRKFQLTSLRTVVSLIPIAERAYREKPSQSLAFAMNALMTQARELINDLQAVEDRGALVERVLHRVLTPAFTQIGQVAIDNMYQLRRELETVVDEGVARRVSDKVMANLRAQAASYQEIFFDTRKRVSEELDTDGR